jgi:hypothetical protein
METYNNYDYGTGGLFFSNMSSGLGGLGGGLGNLDRLTSGQQHRAYDIFSSFNLPPIPKVAADDIFLSDEEENGPKSRLPLFSRCPLTNRAQLEPAPSNTMGGKMKSMSLSPLKNLTIGTSPIKSRGSPMKSRQYDIMGHSPRIPLLSLANQANRMSNYQEPAKISYSQVARKPAEPASPEGRSGDVSPTFNNTLKNAKQPSSAVKLSLDDVKDDSLVALTNKHGKGKYWFKSGCPTPDPRWNSCQQLMIGPIPGDVEYSTLRSAFLSKGHTIHLFIQNNQAWLEKNQEKFGKKQVKFGYVVYTDSMVAQRLLSAGHVMVGHAKVAVKEMDGQPAQFVN